MDWKHWAWQAFVVIAVVIVVLALLRVWTARTRFDPVEKLAGPFLPPLPQSAMSDQGISA